MTITDNKKKVILIILIMLQLIAALCFCAKKTGYHYDEKYSYYSSNVTYGLVPSDNEWLDTQAIRDEFMVTEGKAFQYGMVKLMQTYDVHPPMYYWVLHTVCSLTSNNFSKWQGLSVNIIFFVASIIMLIAICNQLSDNPLITIFTVALYGFSPAIYSGVTFIRMYVMLTFLCFLSMWIHLRGLTFEKRTALCFYIPVFITTYIGFMTHYYFVVFLFFIAAYMSLYLFLNKDTRKQSFIYAASVIAGMILEVITYPSCLRHIFRGYRGTEAIGSFFDLGNLSDRAGLFVGLLQEYLLCNTFYVLLLIILVMYVTKRFLETNSKRLQKTDSEEVSSAKKLSFNHNLGLTITVTLGYFLVVLKTALQNAEEAVRYEMPVYGLIILLIVLALFNLCGKRQIIAVVILFATLGCQFMGLANNKVRFLYPEEAEERAFAIDHREDDIIYIYNYVNQWMIWDNAMELGDYKDIFFIEMNNDQEITDSRVCTSDDIYAYVMRYDEANNKLQQIIDINPNVSTAELVEERDYVDIYRLR